jgi:D-sedoheptulose 7-phosphate isomerase
LTASKQYPCPVPAILSSQEYFTGLGEVLARIPFALVDQITERLFAAYQQGRTTYLFGNGGSAALASHVACDLGKGTAAAGRKRFRAVSLTDNVPVMTAWANDFHYDDIFAEQLVNLVEAGDIALAISTSGTSPNVVKALQVARDAGAFTIGLTGFEGGKMKALCDLCLVVPSNNVQFLEDAHLGVTHAIFTSLRQRIANLDAR